LNDTVTSHSFADDWDVYWRGKDEADPRSDVGPQDEAPSEFWKAFFLDEFPRHSNPQFLDAACGHGAVTEIALAAAESLAISNVELACMDYSASAVQALKEKFPGVKGVACDIIGLLLNLAAKMQSVTKPNQIVIGEQIYNRLNSKLKTLFQRVDADTTGWNYKIIEGETYSVYACSPKVF